MFAVPHCLCRVNPENTELHLFSTASNDAFASVAYLVCRYQDSSPSSCLIASKSRVSPVKAMAISRLELMGAVLSSILAQNILKVITVDKITFWTDSENVWYWLRNQRRTLTYVISDHGTNFVGTERELRELVEVFDADKVTQEPSKYHPIDWKFNPLSAPHFGGVF